MVKVKTHFIVLSLMVLTTAYFSGLARAEGASPPYALSEGLGVMFLIFTFSYPLICWCLIPLVKAILHK